MKKKSAAVLLAAVALAGGARAGTVTYSFDNDLESTDIHQTGSLNLFDSSMGALTGISLSFKASQSTTFLYANFLQTQDVTVEEKTQISFTSALSALNDLLQPAKPLLTLTSSVTLHVDDGGVASGNAYDGHSLLWESELNSILGSFSVVGGGAFNLDCSSTGEQSGDSGAIVLNRAQCGASITYTFDDLSPAGVPEPAMPALVGIAMLGLWAARRRQG